MGFRYTIKQLKNTRQWLRDNPDGTVKVHHKNGFPEVLNRNQWQSWFVGCLHAKINRGANMTGRKYGLDYQTEMRRAQRQLNHPRLIIDWLPADLKTRFEYRLRCNCI